MYFSLLPYLLLRDSQFLLYMNCYNSLFYKSILKGVKKFMEIENDNNGNLSKKAEEIIGKIFNDTAKEDSKTDTEISSENLEELLPEPQLPSEYTDASRVSLSDSNHYQKHLETHWGF